MFELSVLVSGKGTLLDSLAHHCCDSFDGMLYGVVKIGQVVADRECPALEVAKKWNIPSIVIPYEEPVEEWSRNILDDYCSVKADLHVLAGFLRKLHVPQHLEGKIVNFHPSIDPKYSGKGWYGLKVHQAVVENKEKFTGITMHHVNNEYDKGEIIDQFKMAVLPWDTPKSLMGSVQNMESMFCPRALLNFLKSQSK